MHNLSGTDIATMSSASSNAAIPRLSAVSNAYHKSSPPPHSLQFNFHVTLWVFWGGTI